MRTAVRRSGATPRQIRHWEDLGLIGSVYRSAGGVRLYESSQFDDLRQIQELRQQGFGIDEIRALLDSEAPANELERLAAKQELAAAGAAARSRRLREAARTRRPVAS